MELPPLSLYIHVPWCVRKCPYCDFNSHRTGTDLPEAEYVGALIDDLERDAELAQGRKLHSIFIGGGTPSLFQAESIGAVLNAAEKRLGFADDIEITLEANPGTFEQAKFAGFRAVGVNRLSIGVQSFNDTQLAQLGRIHNRDEARAAVEMARRAGFDNINLDLMHGLPQQSLDDALSDLNQAIALVPEHLSWYQLTIEPNTEFYSKPPTLPLEDTLADIQDAGQALLAAEGYGQYEVSAYAQSGRRSRHNLNYWRFGDYLGIGAGAHGKITRLDTGAIERRHKTRQPNHYLDAANRPRGYLAGLDTLAAEQLPLEFLMNALRLIDGVDSASFSATTGLELTALEPQWSELVQRELVSAERNRLVTTELGQRFLNEVLAAYTEK